MRFYKALNHIKAISFDLDDTLYDNVPVITRAEEILCTELERRYELAALGADLHFWDRMREETLKAQRELEHDVTELRVRTLLRGFVQLGCPLKRGWDEARELIAFFIKVRSEIKVPTSTFDLLAYLGSRYPIAAISNGNSDIQCDGLAPYFRYDLRPALHGAKCKPNPDLFLSYAKKLGIRPQEILHVGDDPLTDVQGAVEAGCQCAWLEGGYAGKCRGASALRVLPQVVLSSLEELRELL